jgi:hypothetical protein
LAKESGAADPEQLAQQLVLLYDGVSVSAQMDHNIGAAAAAREVAEKMLEAQISDVVLAKPKPAFRKDGTITARKKSSLRPPRR